MFTNHPNKIFYWQLLISLAFNFLIGCANDETTSSSKTPNILFIVADDLGYTDLGGFGSEIATPNLDALAHNGVTLTNYYVAPTCSPTRAMLLSGIDNHLVGMGSMSGEQSDNQKNKIGYEGYLNFRIAALPNVLKDNDYHTYMTGKWHLGYDDNTSPTARGFERSFSLLAGGAGHFSNMLSILGTNKAPYREDGKLIDSLPDDFYSTKFYTDKMIEYIDSNRNDGKPFFGYLSYTAVHWPLQAPQSSMDRQSGKYDEGYDVIYERRLSHLKELGLIDEEIRSFPGLPEDRPWEDLNEQEKKRSAKLMEIYAAMVSDMDHNVGKIVEYLEDIGELDNTFIFFMSDNGAEGHPLDETFENYGIEQKIKTCCDNRFENMGRPDSYLWYGSNWARVSVGPWRRFKGFTSEGGIKAPAFVHFPKFHSGSINNSFVTVKDVMPTILEVANISHPGEVYKGREILPMQGLSMMPILLGESDYIHKEDHIEGWELFGKTALRKGGWKMIQEPKEDFFSWQTPLSDNYKWQLFNLTNDPTELNDLAEVESEKMQEMLDAWEQYKKENGVIIPENVMGF
jgi:arylsulfatase